jgi:hypothetical protein
MLTVKRNVWNWTGTKGNRWFRLPYFKAIDIQRWYCMEQSIS